MIPVSSSHISSIGYNGSALVVEFKNGSVYAYPGVTKQKYLEMLSASSPGLFLNEKIKPYHAATKVK